MLTRIIFQRKLVQVVRRNESGALATLTKDYDCFLNSSERLFSVSDNLLNEKILSKSGSADSDVHKWLNLYLSELYASKEALLCKNTLKTAPENTDKVKNVDATFAILKALSVPDRDFSRVVSLSNSILSLLIKDKQFIQAYELMNLMLSVDIEINRQGQLGASQIMAHFTRNLRKYPEADKLFEAIHDKYHLQNGARSAENLWKAKLLNLIRWGRIMVLRSTADQMQREGFPLTEVTGLAMLNAFWGANQLDEVEAVWRQMCVQGVQSLQATAAYVRFCRSQSRIDAALLAVSQFRARGGAPDSNIYSELSHLVLEAPLWLPGYRNLAHVVLDWMGEDRFPDVMLAYELVFPVLALQGDFVGADYYLHELRRKGLTPSPRVYECVMEAYRRSCVVGQLSHFTGNRAQFLGQQCDKEAFAADNEKALQIARGGCVDGEFFRGGDKYDEELSGLELLFAVAESNKARIALKTAGQAEDPWSTCQTKDEAEQTIIHTSYGKPPLFVDIGLSNKERKTVCVRRADQLYSFVSAHSLTAVTAPFLVSYLKLAASVFRVNKTVALFDLFTTHNLPVPPDTLLQVLHIYLQNKSDHAVTVALHVKEAVTVKHKDQLTLAVCDLLLGSMSADSVEHSAAKKQLTEDKIQLKKSMRYNKEQ